MGRAESRSGGPDLSGWSIEVSHGLASIVCEALNLTAGLGHAFSTRRGPRGEDFDLGAHDATEAPYHERRRLLCEAAGLPGGNPVILEQVHGDRIVDGHEAASGGSLRGDAVCCFRTETPGLVAAVRTADCVPILLADGRGRALGAVHAGWRGTARSIASRAVAALAERGIAPEVLLAAIGPAIGPCCYEVGLEVTKAVARATDVDPGVISGFLGEGRTLDLALANRRQLERAGVPAASIHTAPWCTACNRDLFFSYRGEGGPTGRMMACIGWS